MTLSSVQPPAHQTESLPLLAAILFLPDADFDWEPHLQDGMLSLQHSLAACKESNYMVEVATWRLTDPVAIALWTLSTMPQEFRFGKYKKWIDRVYVLYQRRVDKFRGKA